MNPVRLIKRFLVRRWLKQNTNKLKRAGLKLHETARVFTSARNLGSEPYLVKVGAYSIVTAGVKFITHDGAIKVFNWRDEYKHLNNKFGRIEIKEHCFIGMNSLIMPNVTIGPNSVVGAGAVVHRDVPPGVIVAGNPARVICKIDEYVKMTENQLISGYNDKNLKTKRDTLEKHFWGNTK